MTTREATSLLPRVGDTPVIGSDGRSLADWAAMLAFGAIQWPWLLRSLHGGRLADKQRCSTGSTCPTTPCPISAAGRPTPASSPCVADHIFDAPAAAGRRVRHRRLDPDPRPRAAEGRRRRG